MHAVNLSLYIRVATPSYTASDSRTASLPDVDVRFVPSRISRDRRYPCSNATIEAGKVLIRSQIVHRRCGVYTERKKEKKKQSIELKQRKRKDHNLHKSMRDFGN